MADAQPRPISADELARRRQRVERIARALGFVGRIEYRHENRGTGGAQYGLGRQTEDDLLVVDATGFARDANPEEFSLVAIIAHECGHQLLHRHPRFRALLARWGALSSEELMASVAGALLVANTNDENHLLQKAVVYAVSYGIELNDAIWLVTELRAKMEKLL